MASQLSLQLSASLACYSAIDVVHSAYELINVVVLLAFSDSVLAAAAHSGVAAKVVF